jgi:hypothetical protein
LLLTKPTKGLTVARWVDLDDAAGVELAWMELRHRQAIRRADPELRAAIIRACDRLPSELAAPILVDLDEMHPAAVLDGHFRTLVADRPTIGHRRRCAREART